MTKYPSLLILFLFITIVFAAGCTEQQTAATSPPADRESKIPADVIKVTQQTDLQPPKVVSPDYRNPLPVPGAVNTAGAEDSPFILPDGNTRYLFFTHDVRGPVEKQITDGVTGIWVSKKANGNWQKPERVMLQDAGKLSLDGCGFVSGYTMWFCAAREGYTGIHWFTADLVGGKWTNWKNADFDPDFKVGELHIYGDDLCYHSDRSGGKGGLDIWVSRKVSGQWQQPVNVEAVNSVKDEGGGCNKSLWKRTLV